MKDTLADHVDTVKHHIFKQSLDEAKASLTGMVESLKTLLREKINGLRETLRTDYTSVLGNLDISNKGGDRDEPKSALRQDILSILEIARPLFQRIASGQMADDELNEINGSLQHEKVPVSQENGKAKNFAEKATPDALEASLLDAQLQSD